LRPNDLDCSLREQRGEFIEVRPDRGRIGEDPIDRNERGYRREYCEKDKERDAGGDRDYPVLANRAVEKTQDFEPRATCFRASSCRGPGRLRDWHV
jgi:hypothetical protein